MADKDSRCGCGCLPFKRKDTKNTKDEKKDNAKKESK